MKRPKTLYQLYSQHWHGEIVSMRALRAIQLSMLSLDFEQHRIKAILRPDFATVSYMDYDDVLEVFVWVHPEFDLEIEH